MISVLVVDDSVVVRRLIVDALSGDPEIHVAGTAPNGQVALTKIDALKPDLITLDIEMPVMDGLTTLKNLRRKHAKLPVIMFSTLTAAGASATFDALQAGASDYVTKPANVGSVVESIRSVKEQLIPRIHALCGGRTAGRRPPAGASRRPGASGPAGRTAVKTRPLDELPKGTPDIVAIGCSTGGPDALTKVLAGLPSGFPVPILVVQHMPPVFTKLFADRLDRTMKLKVTEARDGMPLLPGHVYIAPGDHHLEAIRRGTTVMTRLHGGPPENSCRPAVDVLFRSVAKVYGKSSVAVVLTGMGYDGRAGSEELIAAGAEVVAQDEQSSVVWGMPGAVATAGLAHAVLPLEDIAPHLNKRVGPPNSHPNRPAGTSRWR